MFQVAYEEARKFTLPLVLALRRFDGRVETGLASFIVLNDEGWVATAAHVLEPGATIAQDQQAIQAYEQQVDAINQGPGSDMQKRTKRSVLHRSNDWVTNISLWWGDDRFRHTQLHAYPDVDLLVTKLDPFDPGVVATYPRFKIPTNLTCGTSLCKLGFPFHTIDSTFDATTQTFAFVPGALPMPLFPIDGIVTRFGDGGTSAGGYPIRWVETSSPGLRGQSGGPTFDRDGVVYAIQLQTSSYDLGFTGTASTQYLHVGVGIHTAVLEAILVQLGVTVQWAP
jgi:Trypsin-like peptidase domain